MSAPVVVYMYIFNSNSQVVIDLAPITFSYFVIIISSYIVLMTTDKMPSLSVYVLVKIISRDQFEAQSCQNLYKLSTTSALKQLKRVRLLHGSTMSRAARNKKAPGAEFAWKSEGGGEVDTSPTPLFPVIHQFSLIYDWIRPMHMLT